MAEMTSEMREELENELKTLEGKLTGNMFDDMDIRDKMHNIKMKLDGVRPSDSFVECIGCGS